MAVTYNPRTGQYEQDYEGETAPPPGTYRGQQPPQGDMSPSIDGLGVAYIVKGGRAYLLDGTPYLPVPIPQRQTAPGRTFEQDMALAQTPRVSYSSSQSFSDPAALAIQRQQLEEQIRGNLAQEARDQQLMEFNRDKWRVESARADRAESAAERAAARAEADRAAQLAETIRSRIESSTLARQQMQQQRDLAVAQMEASSREGALNRQQRAQESQRADRLARDRAAAEYAAAPTDVGRMSAILAADGQSNISTALGQGQTAITDQSIEPLAALLYPDVPTETPQPGPLTQAVNAVPQQTPEQKLAADQAKGRALAAAFNAGVELPELTRLTTPAPPAPGPLTQAMSAAAATPRDAANASMEAQKVPDFVPRYEDGGAVVDGEEIDGKGFLNGLMLIAQALHMQPKAIAGEKGKANGETVWSNGDVMVMPDEGEGMPEMASGGLVVRDPILGPVGAPTGSTGTLADTAGLTVAPGTPQRAPQHTDLLNPRLQLARDFLTRAQQMTLQRSGFERAPTPIEFADPGTDPYRQQLAAAVTAQVKGINPQSFLNEAMRLRPQGMQRGYASRTR